MKNVNLAIEKLEKLKQSQERAETFHVDNQPLIQEATRKLSVTVDDSKLPVVKRRSLKTKRSSLEKVIIQYIVCNKT